MSPTPSFSSCCHLTLVLFIVITSEPIWIRCYSQRPYFIQMVLHFTLSGSHMTFDISAAHLLVPFLTVWVTQTLLALVALMLFSNLSILPGCLMVLE